MSLLICTHNQIYVEQCYLDQLQNSVGFVITITVMGTIIVRPISKQLSRKILSKFYRYLAAIYLQPHLTLFFNNVNITPRLPFTENIQVTYILKLKWHCETYDYRSLLSH